MYQIVYVSEAAVPFDAEDLRKLLAVARRKNTILGVTGMLVSYKNQFLQVLEGDAANVISAYDRIEKDNRHKNLLVLHRGYSSVGKTFRESSMGFFSVELNAELPAEFQIENKRLDFALFDGLTALEFLVACRRQSSSLP